MSKQQSPKEAILLASPPNIIRDSLQKRAEKAALFDPISSEVEAELLSKGDRLIDLSLAEYCLHSETARDLFQRDLEDWPIRALVLSNEALSKASFIEGFPEILFESEEALLIFLSKVSSEERAILFRNPSIDDEFLESFLSLGKPWETMDSEQRLWAISELAYNKKLQTDRDEVAYEDGYDWYKAGTLFTAAWALVKRLEPTREAARHLSRLLDRLPADSHSIDGILEALQRWKLDEANEDMEEEVKNQKGHLSDFQMVRQAGARLLARSYKFDTEQLIQSEDIAFRCGAYEGSGKLTSKQTERAVERDGDLARLYLIRNDAYWRNKKTRESLFDLLRGAKTEEPRWELNRSEENYLKKFPHWFEDEEHLEPDERPLIESTIADLVSGIVSDTSFKQMQMRLAALEEKQLSFRWMLLLSLILLLIILWR